MTKVKGIDRDGESRCIPVEAVPVDVLAADLADADWKCAVIVENGEIVGGVGPDVDARTHKRRPWKGSKHG